LERAETFRIAEGGRPRHFTPLAAACAAWKVGVKTGPGIQTIAALGHYGLFEFQGKGETRAARLTDLAFRILLDKQPNSPERDKLIQQAALTPRIHAELWAKWGADLPSNVTLETHLVRDGNFSEPGARDLIAEYKATIAFVKFGKAANIPPEITVEDEGHKHLSSDQDIEVGDFIQVEIDGALALEGPTRVRAIQEHEGRVWAFIEGSEAGIPVEQAILERKGSTDPPRLPEDKSQIPPQLGTRREVFALDEGDVTLTYPETFSSDSYDELEAHLQVFLRKARRRAMTTEEAAKRILRAFPHSKAGDILSPSSFAGKISLPGVIADFGRYMDYALQQGWVEMEDREYRLTETGLAVAQST